MTRLAENPFFVLGISPDASRIEIEREAQKLLGMLELGFAAAETYATPIGPRPRTPEAVRAAVAALRDPYQRLLAEAKSYTGDLRDSLLDEAREYAGKLHAAAP